MDMIDNNLLKALGTLADGGNSLREQFHFDWNRQAAEATLALRYLFQPTGMADKATPGPMVAIVGGASSGKSTVFNNLLRGAQTSRVTAKGHATRGPIAAIHESRRDEAEAAFEVGLLFPSFERRPTTLNEGAQGEPGCLHIVYHNIPELRDVFLVDMPDFTSEPARQEGDIAMAMLPWFDRLIVLVDHERWFDCQTIGQLREESARFGQERFVVFNRSQAGELSEPQLAKLRQQADRLGAVGNMVLEFRHGRGCPVFPPGTLDSVEAHFHPPRLPRTDNVLTYLGQRAGQILNNNAERKARLSQLRQALDKAVATAVPSSGECLTALLNPAERRHLDILTRTLRIRETRDWLSQQADRIKATLRRKVPVLGSILTATSDATQDEPEEGVGDRQTIGWEVFRTRCKRQQSAIEKASSRSDFWREVRRWTGIGPSPLAQDLVDAQREEITELVSKIDSAVTTWNAKVEAECKGAYPSLFGAVGGGTVAAAIMLVAVTGPVSALTIPVAMGTLGSAFGTLLASVGAGAVAGGPMKRLMAVIQERLIKSPEFTVMRDAIEDYRGRILSFGQGATGESMAEAESLVLAEDGKLGIALTTICDAAEID